MHRVLKHMKLLFILPEAVIDSVTQHLNVRQFPIIDPFRSCHLVWLPQTKRVTCVQSLVNNLTFVHTQRQIHINPPLAKIGF